MGDLTQRGFPAAGQAGEGKPVSAGWQPREGSKVGFGFLIAFFVVYCARPEDWISPLRLLPVAKITACGAALALLTSRGGERIRFSKLPREFHYVVALVSILVVSSLFSPVWKGGALNHTIDFAKIIIIFLLVYLLVTDLRRLRELIFVQAASMIVVTAISVARGYHTPRLEGVIGGIFSNPNDLAFAIVLTIPFCMALLITTKSMIGKLAWVAGILIMLPALFLTASRAGFIDLICAGAVVLWHYGVKGRRFYLIVITAFLGVLLLATVGQKLMQRFEAISEGTQGDNAYGSYEARKYLMEIAIQGIERYPIFGVGVNDFMAYSGTWQPVHMTYLQMAVEGGLIALFFYLAIFWRGFKNLRQLLKRKDLPEEYRIYAGAVHASLVGFVIGAMFSPEAYHFFPFFSVAFTSAMVAMLERQEGMSVPTPVTDWRQRRKAMNLWA
jgi:O-antigen ligase